MKKGLLIVLILLIVLTCVFLVSCEYKEDATIENIEENITKKAIDVTYDRFDGVKTYEAVHLNKGKIITYEITTKEGSLSMIITDSENNEVFNQDVTNDIKKIIEITNEGDYTLMLKGENHMGGYILSWE